MNESIRAAHDDFTIRGGERELPDEGGHGLPRV
jgi:hypothetical protein